MNRTVNFKELSRLIVTAIEDEQFFNKDILIPKVKAIISSFNQLNTAAKYDAIEKPSDAQRRLRALEESEIVINFWKRIVKELVPFGGIKPYFDKLDEHLTSKGFPPKNKISKQ